MAKPKEKERARELRNEGWSYKQIAKEINVSSSTVGVWCEDIKLSPTQIESLEKRSRDPYYGNRWIYIIKRKAEKNRKIDQANKDAATFLGDLNNREKLIIGVALYWAEGFKKDKQVGFSNTDPEMIIFILDWLTHCMNVNEDDIRLRVGINEGHDYRVEEIEKYWIEKTGYQQKYFYKPYFQKVKWQKKYDHPEKYFGTLRIRVLKSTILLRRIKGLIGAINLNITN